MDQLFSSTNIATFGVATTIVTVVANALYKLAKLPPKWTAFAAAMVVAYLIVGISQERQWYDWLVAFFNACLLYCSALGLNDIGAATTQPEGKGFATTEGFFADWLQKGAAGSAS